MKFSQLTKARFLGR